MATLAELTVQVLTARLAKKEMTLDELQKEMAAISTMLKDIDAGTLQEPVAEDAPEQQVKIEKINFRKIFRRDKVVCLICSKEFTTLKRHLAVIHQLKPAEYKKQFNIPAKYTLVASAYSDKKKQDALNRGLGNILVKARENKAKKKAAVPAVRVKPPVPAVKLKAPVPMKRVKAAMPMKTETTKPVTIKPAKPEAKSKVKTILTEKVVKTRKKK